MNKSKWFLTGMAGLLLSFALILTGCPADAADPRTDDAGTDGVGTDLTEPVTGVILNKTSLTLEVGPGEILTVTVMPDGDVNKAVTWTSSDPGVAKVTSGTVTAVAPGTATITVTTVDGGFTANCDVTVTPPAGERDVRTIGGVSVPFRYVPAGRFQRDSKLTNITVISKGYWMGETEVTQELFQKVMGVNPSYFDGSSGANPAKATPRDEIQDRRPVESVNWYAAIAFCNKLSLLDGKEPVYGVNGISDWEDLAYDNIPTSDDSDWDAAEMDTSKDGYRLPTSMEWMWAATGANTTTQPNTTGYRKPFAGSSNKDNYLDNCAWLRGNSNETHQVGKKNANELGIHDMSGNVGEWCWDRDGANLAVVRGGSWFDNASKCAVAEQSGVSANESDYRYGLRVVRNDK
jgi:formylglycine-generating enzyme required for sulfatase activity